MPEPRLSSYISPNPKHLGAEARCQHKQWEPSWWGPDWLSLLSANQQRTWWRLPNWTSPQNKRAQVCGISVLPYPSYFSDCHFCPKPLFSCILISKRKCLCMHISYMYNVTISYLSCKKKTGKGTYFDKSLWLYYLPIFFPSPLFFLVIVNQVPSVLSFLYVCFLLYDMFCWF